MSVNIKSVASLTAVGVTIDGREILSDIDFAVEELSTVAIIGASGSGKSTLLRLLNGMRLATRGDVLRRGKPIAEHDMQNLRRATGYALQETGLFPHMTVYDNIQLPFDLAGVPTNEARERIHQLTTRLQLTDAQLQRYPSQLSGGQQQRAGLCRALALNPDLLLLDEAFSGLDAITRNHALDTFLALREDQALTTVLVTHDLNEARRIADWLVVLDQGKIVRQGPRDEVLRDPVHPYARALIEAFS